MERLEKLEVHVEVVTNKRNDGRMMRLREGESVREFAMRVEAVMVGMLDGRGDDDGE